MHSENSPGPKQDRLWCTFLPGVPAERKQKRKLCFKPVRGSRAAFFKIQDSFHSKLLKLRYFSFLLVMADGMIYSKI